MIAITRKNIDDLLDHGNGRWYQTRRNGATRKWKRDASRIYVPFKYGFKGYGRVTENDFSLDTPPRLNGGYYRHIDDVPADLRP